MILSLNNHNNSGSGQFHFGFDKLSGTRFGKTLGQTNQTTNDIFTDEQTENSKQGMTRHRPTL